MISMPTVARLLRCGKPKRRSSPQGEAESSDLAVRVHGPLPPRGTSRREGGPSPGADESAATVMVMKNEEDELREVFKVFDGDGDGKITAEELGRVLRRLGGGALSDEELTHMVAAADTDRDGCISVDEFVALNTVKDARRGDASCAHEEEDGRLRDAFRIFDRDGNGLISPEELQRVLRCLGDLTCTVDECSRMIHVIDQDGDGFVDFREFTQMMTATAIALPSG